MTDASAASKASAAPAPQLVQRRCECGGVPGPDGECAACKARRLGLQRSAASPDPAPVDGHVPGNSAGRPLDAATRTAMETAFGRDFGGVRVHTDVSGGRAAEALGAHAYTVGSDIYFAAGRYAPRGPAGARLLAHELAHTIHQQGAAQVQTAHAIDPPGSPLEVEVDRAAKDAVAGRRALVRGRVSHHLPQRQAAGGERRTRTIPGGHVDVTRRLEPQPCSRVPDTQSRGEVYLDRSAEAFGVRFGFCRGNTDVDFDSALRYGNLLQQARDLARSVPQTALAGGDPLGAIETAVRAGTITGQASVTATISGVLVAQVSGSTTQGVQERSYEVSGLLRINPGGSWALELSAEYQHIVSDLGGTTTRAALHSAGRLRGGSARRRRRAHRAVGVEVLFLQSPISKAFSVATLCGLTLAPVDGPDHASLLAHDARVPAVAPPLEGEDAEPLLTESPSKAKSAEPDADAPASRGHAAAGMLLVDGDYCPDAEQTCLKWLDPPPYQNLRCGEYAKPAKCKGPRQHRRFCVDREEYAEPAPPAPKRRTRSPS